MMSDKPRLAIIPGDPAGIGPELIAKLLSTKDILQIADIVLVGDEHLWQQGAEQAGLEFNVSQISEDEIKESDGVCFLNMETISPEDVRYSEVTFSGGVSSLRTLDKALDLAVQRQVDGVLFGPFNKASLTKAHLNAEDEHVYMARYLDFSGHHSEINVLDELMTTRVTSHIGLKDVAKNISQEGVMKAIKLAHDTLRRAGNIHPKIAVAALNPHAGDNGKFGREEIDILEPAVKDAKQKQINASGPWPSDTVFLKAKNGEVDAVVTMYHDQGQIAIKLMGFERGVTVAGGLPIPVTTPAHGTAFDIVNQNKANVGATLQAFKLLARMANTHRKEYA